MLTYFLVDLRDLVLGFILKRHVEDSRDVVDKMPIAVRLRKVWQGTSMRCSKSGKIV